MTVAAHTNSVGYFRLLTTVKASYDVRSVPFGSLRQTTTRSPVTAISNKAPTVYADGVKSTPYFRKVGRITSLAAPKVETSSHRFESESSLGYRGIDMYEGPAGSFYAASSVSLPQWMTDQVIQNAMLELESKRANILEDLAQMHQTIDMAWALFKPIVELFAFYYRHRRNPSAAWKYKRRKKRGDVTAKEVANHWLAFYYGVKPLISTLDALLANQEPRMKTVSTRKRVSQQLDPRHLVVGSSSITCDAGKLEQRAQCGMTVKVELSSTLSYWSSLGLSGPGGSATDLDALVTLWAIAPWSFVVDWILPVERFLRTRAFSSGIVYQTGYVSKTLTGSGTFTETNPMTGSGDAGVLPRVRVDCHQFNRLAYNHFVPPSGLTLYLSLTSTQTFNAIALILQRG